MEEQFIDYGKIRPTVSDNWSKDKEWERLTIMTNNSKTYISKKDVPAGIELYNTEYWQLLIDGGIVVTKEDKANKKTTLDDSDPDYYPNTAAVKGAIQTLTGAVNGKLNRYLIEGDHDVFIKPAPCLIYCVQDDIPEEGCLLLVNEDILANEQYLSIWGTPLYWNITRAYDSETNTDYFHIEHTDTHGESDIIIIPLGRSALEISTSLENEYETIALNEVQLQRKLPLTGRSNNSIEQDTCSVGGANAFAEGKGTRTINEGEHAEGKYNIPIQNKTQHTVGIGSAFNNKKNAHIITVDGKHYILGVGGFTGQETTASQLNSHDDLATVIDNIITDIEDIKTDVRGAIFDCDNWAGGGTFGILSLSEIQQIYSYYYNNISVKIRKTSDNKLQDIIACDMVHNELYTKDWTISDSY